MRENCPFCSPDTEKNHRLFEGETCYVMLSNPRKVKGHLLVIPKRHVEKPFELNEAERKELFEVVLRFQEKILKKMAAGCDINQNCRPFLPQNRLKVDHVHFHLIPREINDELFQKSMRFADDLFSDLTEEEIKEVSLLLT